MYQASNPNLSKYDIILLDEAQDTNPCVLNIIDGQLCGKVLVGDPHQNIYGFRQSINAMDCVKGETLSLTSSFRFGANIADTVNSILGTFCNESREIKGLRAQPASDRSHCYLHRTNAGLFGRAASLLSKGAKMHFVGGVYNYGFDSIVDTWKLYAGQSDIRDTFIRRFRDYSELCDYAESAQDREIASRLSIVDTFGAQIPSLVSKISMSECPADSADVTLTTAHKSKGLEWGYVTLGEDFPDLMAAGEPLTASTARRLGKDPLSTEEANLIYVASTRAKNKIAPYESLREFESWYFGESTPSLSTAP